MEFPRTENFRMELLDSRKNGMHYGVVNEYTGLTEHHDAFFSRAYKAMMKMQKEWDEMIREWKTPKLKEVK